MEQRHLPLDEPLPLTEVREGLLRPEEPATEMEAEIDTEAEEQATAALTTLLQQEACGRRNETWITLAWSGAFITSMIWLVEKASLSAPLHTEDLWRCFAMMLAFGWVLMSQFRVRLHRRKRSLTNALSQINDKKQIGPLIRTLRVQNTPVRNLAKQSLIELLPTLRASDSSLLEPGERKVLLRQLTILPNDPGYRDVKELFSRSAFRRELDFRLAILKALEQVGAEQELETVERLARSIPSPQNPIKIPQELRAAAQECLPYLQARANDQRASSQLLRASGFPALSGDDLLRPATSSLEAHPEQLLHAAEPRS